MEFANYIHKIVLMVLRFLMDQVVRTVVIFFKIVKNAIGTN